MTVISAKFFGELMDVINICKIISTFTGVNHVEIDYVFPIDKYTTKKCIYTSIHLVEKGGDDRA